MRVCVYACVCVLRACMKASARVWLASGTQLKHTEVELPGSTFIID